MPNKKQTSRKNQGVKPKADTPKDDEWGSIIVKSAPNSRASTRSNKVKPEPIPEPSPAIPDWEKVGMNKEDFEALMERMRKAQREYDAQVFLENMLADLNSPSYWYSRIETLEMCRERYNKKAAWSAEVIRAVDEIDAEIAECEGEIYRIESEFCEAY
jgi:hypothetical protein